MKGSTVARMGLTLDGDDAARAAAIAQALGTSKAAAVKAALEVAATVYADPVAAKMRRGADALAAYCEGRGAAVAAPSAL